MSFLSRMQIVLWMCILNCKSENFVINTFILWHIHHVITFQNSEFMGEIQDL